MKVYAEFEMGFRSVCECVTFQRQDNYWQVLCNFTMIFTSNKSGMLVFSDSVPPQ